jgi:hypothetical protein
MQGLGGIRRNDARRPVDGGDRSILARTLALLVKGDQGRTATRLVLIARAGQSAVAESCRVWHSRGWDSIVPEALHGKLHTSDAEAIAHTEVDTGLDGHAGFVNVVYAKKCAWLSRKIRSASNIFETLGDRDVGKRQLGLTDGGWNLASDCLLGGNQVEHRAILDFATISCALVNCLLKDGYTCKSGFWRQYYSIWKRYELRNMFHELENDCTLGECFGSNSQISLTHEAVRKREISSENLLTSH